MRLLLKVIKAAFALFVAYRGSSALIKQPASRPA
jgi:hypothetical protein